MSKLKVLFLFTFILSILVSCSKQQRIENKISGNWVLEEMRIVDGQGFTYYLNNVEGELNEYITRRPSYISSKFNKCFY